jgi:arylsulfatase A-like enzyme
MHLCAGGEADMLRAMCSKPKPMSRFSCRLVWVALVLGCAACDATGPAGDAGSETAASGPDVVLIVVDTLRSDRLSHAGYSRPTASGLDAFAANASFFPNAYAATSWTRPSAASLLTGLEALRLNVGRGTGLGEGANTLAEVLQRHGWHTYGFSFNYNVSSKTGMSQGFDHFDDEFVTKAAGAYPDISEMMRRAREQIFVAEQRPLHLYLHPMNTHGPYWTPARFNRALLGRAPSSAFQYNGPVMQAILRDHDLTARGSVSPMMLSGLNEVYDTAIRHTTDRIGEFLEFLREGELYDDSIIIITSDHGEELFDHGGFTHGYSLHEEVLRVPIYIKLPNQREGRVVDAPVSLMDIYPTVLAAAGIREQTQVDGRSLLPLIRGDKQARREAAEREFVHELAWPGRARARAITSGRYRLIAIEESYEGLRDVRRLYDRRSDPAEQRDLSAREPELSQRLFDRMNELFDARSEGIGSRQVVPSDAERAQLEALGYGS